MEDSGIDSDPKAVNPGEDERSSFMGSNFQPSDSSCSSNQTHNSERSTTKQLQRKLEARIEQAKRIQRSSEYIKLSNNDKISTSSGNSGGLIPIQRLPIPHKNNEHHPLVEYWRSDSESENETTLFPLSRGKDSAKHKQDLTDTFSIEELSEGSEDSFESRSGEKFSSSHAYLHADRMFLVSLSNTVNSQPTTDAVEVNHRMLLVLSPIRIDEEEYRIPASSKFNRRMS